jgi:hypothetical protein
MPFEFSNEEKLQIKAKLNDWGSNDPSKSREAGVEVSKALETPIRQTVLTGDILGDIFTVEDYTDGSPVKYPTDLIKPGTEKEFYAFTLPDHGGIPTKLVTSDSIIEIPTYMIGNSIGCTRKFLRDANWNVLARMVEVLEAGFKKKLNDDGFNTIISAGVSRNILVYDPDAAAGQFTPRLVTLLKTVMRRNGGGNSTSVNRGKLTHLYLSPEALDDIRSWNLNLIPDQVRTNIYYTDDNGREMTKIFGVELRDLDELGVGQEYQLYYSSTLGKSLASGDVELAIGIDKSKNNSFVMPIRENLQMFEDNTKHRQGLNEMYGWMEVGFAQLDSRTTLLASF